MLAGALITAAFGRDDDPSPGVVVDWVTQASGGTARTPTPVSGDGTASPRTTPREASPTPSAEVAGFAYPIEGGCLPEDDNLMPGAPREYREGVHEGVDFYDSDNCASVGLDAEVLAAKAGTVIRADFAYEDLTGETLQALLDRVQEEGGASSDVEDAFRGRQVWIDHGDGIVTRYAHLSGIADGIAIGSHVAQGDVIAYVGESGTPESVTDPGTQVHLHFEIRVGESYLGEGLPPDQLRALYERAFSP